MATFLQTIQPTLTKYSTEIQLTDDRAITASRAITKSPFMVMYTLCVCGTEMAQRQRRKGMLGKTSCARFQTINLFSRVFCVKNTVSTSARELTI
jgi:hypothetical protein